MMRDAATAPLAHQQLWEALAAGDADAGRDIVRRQLAAGVPGTTVVLDLLAPAQRAVGLEWQRATWSAADEHAATAVVDAALAVVEQNATRRGPTGTSVVVACAETEWHALPARLAAQQLREAGVRVTFLGPSLPADHLREYLARLGPDALVLSATMPTALPGAARCIDAAHDVGVPVVVGGAAFGDDASCARLLGADVWLSDIALFTVPTVRPVPVPGRALAWPEWEALRATRDVTCDVAMLNLLVTMPAFALAATPAQLARTREDLAHIVDFVAIAVLVDDPRILERFTSWLTDVLAGRGVPLRAVEMSYLALAAALGEGTAASLLTAHAGSAG